MRDIILDASMYGAPANSRREPHHHLYQRILLLVLCKNNLEGTNMLCERTLIYLDGVSPSLIATSELVTRSLNMMGVQVKLVCLY
jgi:hypothetical protein